MYGTVDSSLCRSLYIFAPNQVRIKKKHAPFSSLGLSIVSPDNTERGYRDVSPSRRRRPSRQKGIYNSIPSFCLFQVKRIIFASSTFVITPFFFSQPPSPHNRLYLLLLLVVDLVEEGTGRNVGAVAVLLGNGGQLLGLGLHVAGVGPEDHLVQLVAQLVGVPLWLGLCAAAAADAEELDAVGKVVAVGPSGEDNLGDTSSGVNGQYKWFR